MNRGNPQGTPTESEIAWLAGILEGEGTVSLAAWVRHEKVVDAQSIQPGTMKVSVNLKFYNTDAGIIAKVTDVLSRLGIQHHLKEREQKPMRRASGEGVYVSADPMLTVTVGKLGVAYRLAKLLHPWCFGSKRHRLEMVIQYLANRFAKTTETGHSSIPYDADDLRTVSEFYARFASRPDNNSKLLAGLLNELERTKLKAA